jgi:hypothetical protein
MYLDSKFKDNNAGMVDEEKELFLTSSETMITLYCQPESIKYYILMDGFYKLECNMANNMTSTNFRRNKSSFLCVC